MSTRPCVRLKDWGFGVLKDQVDENSGHATFALLGNPGLRVLGTIVAHHRLQPEDSYYSRVIVRFDGRMIIVSEDHDAPYIMLEGPPDPKYTAFCLAGGLVLNEADPSASMPLISAES